MIDRNNRYDGFCTTESINGDKIIEFLDAFSLKVNKNTFVVLDNASVYRNSKIKELRRLWEYRGLYLFYLSPIFSTFEYCRNAVEDFEGQMGQTTRLYL